MGESIDGPLAYLITFRCYGTWLHGDDRGSVDREHNVPLTPLIEPNAARRRSAMARLKSEPVGLDSNSEK
jgi:hypothetical protein